MLKNCKTFFENKHFYSALSVVAITSATGAKEQEMSYDAWGRRRNPANWSYDGLPDSTTYLINRGYTFHQHYDKLGLINMNGRVYDPIVGRFLSVDPLVGNPLSAQDYNGYSYCANNPMKYTDPSGYTYEQMMENRGCGFGGTGSPTFGEYGSRGGSGYGVDPCNVGDYFYDWSTNSYRTSDAGFGQVSFGEVYYNYARPHALSAAEARVFISRLAPSPPAEGSQVSGVSSNNQIKPGGDNPNKYVLFLTLKQAEKYINKNKEIYGKEIFFYILKDGNVVVGPWSDADRGHVSPRFSERLSVNGISFDGKNYSVILFSHTHFNGADASSEDMGGFNYFNYFGIIPTIYFNGNYYNYDSTGTKGIIVP